MNERTDFTLTTYQNLLKTIKNFGFTFITYKEYMINSSIDRVTILRHDVDRNSQNALAMAELEALFGIKSSYYFRIIRSSNNPGIIENIAKLGHEIGYHYEDLALSKGDYKTAIQSFKRNLDYFRKFYPVTTICMHGSPLSKWDNRLIWNKYDYKEYGIVGEPYFDIDYGKMSYFTDTGRKWNSEGENIRDKINSAEKFNCRTTFDLIDLIRKSKVKNQLMLNIHPQRWNDMIMPWLIELAGQNLRNIIKRTICKVNRT